MRTKSFPKALLLAGAVAVAGLLGAGGQPAAAAPTIGSVCGGLPAALTTTIGPGGGVERAKVTGGALTVDFPPGTVSSPTAMTICSSAPASPYPGDPILSFFAIDFPNGVFGPGLASPLRITFSGRELTAHSFLQVQGGGPIRILSNLHTGAGQLSFDAYAIFEYVVYEHSPLQSQPVAGGASPATGRSSNSDRSTIAAALTPFDKAFPLTWPTLWNAAITIGVMLLITFPAQLFNKTLDENYDEIRSILRRRLPRVVAVRRRFMVNRSRFGGLPSFVAVMIVGSILGGLNDPTFGFNAKSVETLVAVILAFAAALLVSGGVEVGYRRLGRLPADWKLHALPLGLVVAVACVVVSRLTNFEPGYLYGVVAGVAFGQSVDRRQSGHSVALASLATLVVAVAAWAAWTPLQSSASHPHAGAVVLIGDSLLAALFVSGIVGTVINLMPLEFMPGSALARWHRGAWAAVVAVATFLLVQVMLHPAARSYRIPDAPIVTTLVLFGVFACASVAFNRYFAVWRRGSAGPKAEDDTVLVTPQRTSLRP